MKEFIQKNGSVVFTVTVVVCIVFYAGFYAGSTSSITTGDRAGAYLSGQEIGKPIKTDFSSFWKAWNILNEKFVASGTSTPTDDEKVYGAIAGLASSYNDPYTIFFPPVESKMFESDIAGNFEGVGMEVGEKDGQLTVVAPLKGTPAYKAGIKAGDKIIKIDDTFTTGLKVDEAIKIIRGKKGTEVKLTVTRVGKKDPIEFSVIRDVIEMPTIDTEIKSGEVFVIRLYNFSALSANMFRNALREFISSGKSKLIIDLRGNPGGYLEAAVDMASWFLPVGEVVVREGISETDVSGKLFKSRGYDVFNDKLQLIILVDGGSASASEILAGALREHGKATLVGTKTFGKGSVQELVKITGDTSLKVTIARWYTPKGVSISQSGLTPDVVVEIKAEDVAKGTDPQMDKAVEILLKK